LSKGSRKKTCSSCFPLAARDGGVLVRAGHTEAACDYARLAGLTPAGVIADVLGEDGELADGPALAEFAARHALKMGSIADLIEFRVVNERTVERIRQGRVQTAYGEFELRAYREETTGRVHLALCKGAVDAGEPVLVRVHVNATLRDLVHCELDDRPSWSMAKCLRQVSGAGRGVIVLLCGPESAEDLLTSIDVVLGRTPDSRLHSPDHFTNVGVGSQILVDCGVSKIRLMGAPVKYNAISGFGLEVVEYLQPEQALAADAKHIG